MEKDNEEKRIQISRPEKKKTFTGFPLWVWLVMLVVVLAIYLGLSLKG